MASRVLLIAIASVVMGCSNVIFDSPEELQTYLWNPDNGFLQEKKVNDVKYTFCYKPTDLLVSQEIMDDTPESHITSLRKKYKDYAYYLLSFSKAEKEVLTNSLKKREDYQRLLNTLNHHMDKYISIKNESGKTIPLLDFVHPRMYDLDGQNTILLVLEKNKIATSTELKFTIKDMGFSTGEVAFYFDTKMLEKEPQLNF